MGNIPASTNMVSTIIINPAPGQDIAANTPFNITVQVNNLQAGSFTNPDSTYYAAPQDLQGGKIVGHTHVTVQDLGGSLTPTDAPDASTFTFFKGINDAGNGAGLLSAPVAAGLPAGNYRVCTMASASNHQPVLMPVAQRGAQDDCTKFTVGAGGGAAAAAADTAATAATAAAATAATAQAATGKAATAAAAAAKKKKGTGKKHARRRFVDRPIV
jgi:transcription initiation factor TFIID subunit 15